MSLSKHKSIKDDQLPPPDGKINVTILASEWGSSKGGLSTLNRELAIQLAKFPELQISFFVPNCSERDKIAALSHSIKIVQATRRPGYDELEWLSFPPDQLQIDVIVGHGVKLGRQAQFIRNSHKCKWIQVVHTVPEELGMFKTYQNPISTGEKKRKTEVELCEMADVVIGVGPKSCEAFRRYLRYCEKDKNILKITPGVFDEFLNIEHVDKDLKRCGILVFGRGDAEDFELKGFDIAGKAVAEVEEARLTFVGAPEGKHKDIAKRFLKCGVPADRLTIRSFLEDRESLKHLFCEMDLVLMPSRTEKFGLTGLEALSAGLPVLVSRNSGFGEALSEVPFGESYVIDSEDSKVWADEIKKVWRKNRKERLQEVELLRSSYGKVFSWATQSKVFVNKMKDIFHVPHEIKGQGLRAKQAYENALRIGKVPHEIKGQGLRAKQAYENALRIGKVKVYRARIMLIGQDRAGKTSLKKSLLGLPFDAEEQSTVGIEVDPSSFKVDVDQITNWQRTAKKEGVSQFAKELARIVAGDLKNEEAKMDLTPQRELKETRSHKTQEFATLDLSRNESHKSKEQNTLASHHSAPKTPHLKSKSQFTIDASTPPEEFTEYLIQYLKGLNLQGDSSPIEPVVDVDVWDLAGQYLYYASHPVFFSFRALYLLVCNLSKGLNKTAEPYVRQGIHDIRLENPNGETNLENLLSWLASVAAISPTQQEAGEAETPYLQPPVLMVGTHADKPFQDIKEMKIQIQKELSGKGFGRHVITQFFSIDNTQSLSDAGVIKLREEILKVLEKEPYMGEEVPVRWFNFEKVVQALNGNHTFYLNIKDLQAIVKEVCFVKDETELGVMLDFYHDLGVVVKHGSTVVLQAQWLIDLFKQLITIPRYEEVGLESRLLKNWKHLEETGILCMELVRHVFSKFIKEDSVAEKDILDMMERFGLVAKFVTSTQNSVQYFVPAQLKSLPKDQDLCKWEASTSDPCPLYLDFLNGFVPHGIFYQLVSRCISWCSENGFKRLPTLYCHAARFFIVKNFIHPLTLLCKRRYIKIILKHREPVSEECFAEGREVAKDLRNFLKSTLQDMAQQIPWRGNLKCELCVECPFCPIERKPCQNHGKISCTHEECFCLLNMAPAERLLCEKSFCDKVPTIPGLDEWFSMEDKNLKKREETVSRGDISTYGSLKSGPPSCAELQDLANEIQESWQQIGRRLKLCEENLSSINFEEESVYEKSYRMLRKWTEAFHYSANYGTLAQALEHELVDRGDLARKYCYTKHPAETPQVVRVDSPFLKDGTPSEDDLQYLASNIFDCWKVLGRQLDLEESVLISIDWEEKRTSEKCYKMLKKWKECNGSEADFKTLAHGLENHLVERNDLAAKYCYITKASEQARRELQTLTQALQTGLNIHTTSGCVERSNPLRDLATTASGKGYKVFPNQGQGNCLFHALSDQLDIVKGIKIEQSDLRRTLVQYLRDNPTLPDGTDLLGFIDNCQSWEDYLTNMQKDGTWGDEVILRAAANNYGTSILVISNLSVANDITITPYQSGEYKRLVLGHVHEFHYVSLRPIEGHSRKRKLDNEEILDENNRLAKLPIAEKNFNEGHSKSGKLEE